jgi:hypothetical protein
VRKKYEVRRKGDGPVWERWLATFRVRQDAEAYADCLEAEVVEVWDDA